MTRNSQCDNSLGYLLYPLTLDEFVDCYLTSSVLFRPEKSRIFSWLYALIPHDIAEVFRLIHHEQAKVRVIGVLHDKPHALVVDSSRHARHYYDEGYTVVVDNLSDLINDFRLWEKSIEVDLGIPAGTCTIKLSASPIGSGFPLHFDRYETFQLQLYGSKIWQVARNSHVANPLHGHMMGLPLNPALMAYCSAPMPQGFIAQTVELQPGCLLFLPRGYWHGTAASEESLSIVIRCAAPAWLHLLPHWVRDTLMIDKSWREPAYGAWGKTRRKQAALGRLSSLIGCSQLQHLDALELIESFSINENFRDS